MADNPLPASVPAAGDKLKSDFLDDPEVLEFIESEVDIRVKEILRSQQYLQNAALGIVLLIAAVGLALSANAYQRIQDTKAKNERVGLILTRIDAMLKAAGTESKAEDK